MLKQRSKVLFIVVIMQSLLSVWSLFYFNYIDRLNYQESILNNTHNLALLIQNMFTSSWWALIILTFCMISIFSAVCLIYKDIKFQFISTSLWVVLFILAINFKDTLLNNISLVAIFIPIITVSIISYINQRNILTTGI